MKSENKPSFIIWNKIKIPAFRKSVCRDRLLQRLNQGVQQKLTLLTAPAGFGKTTLLTGWAYQTQLPVAWVSIDKNDNHLPRFLTYVLSSIQTILPPLGEKPLQMLRGSLPANLEAVLVHLINEIEEHSQEFVIVLDDYHCIQDNAVHNALEFLLEHLPVQAHLILAARVNPPLPVGKLRVRGELTDITAEDMRFNLIETTAFLNEIMHLKLADHDLRELNKKAEGWAAGLQIAALSMRGELDVSRFISNFSESDRYIGDYLSEEVINNQPEEIQAFLLQASVLPQLNASLCNAITGRTDSQAILEKLDRDNLFITRLEDGVWYRLHQLFSDSLRHSLTHHQPQQVSPLIMRAAAWYEENGYLTQAIEAYLSLSEFCQAARLINSVSVEKLYSGEIHLQLDWLNKLPEDVLIQWPMLMVYHAWALIASDLQFEVADERLKHVEAALNAKDCSDEESSENCSKSENNTIKGSIHALRSYLARLNGDPQSAIPYAQKALCLLPETDYIMRTWAGWNLAEAYRFRGDLDGWAQSLHPALATCQLARNLGVYLLTMDNLAELQIARGELRLAEKTWQNLLAKTCEAGFGNEIPIASTVHAGLGWLYYEWNDFQLATEHLQRGYELAKYGRMMEVTLETQTNLARIHFVQGNVDLAIRLLEEMEGVIRLNLKNRHVIRGMAYRAFMELYRGNRDFFEHWCQIRQMGGDKPIDFSQESEYFFLIRALIHDGHIDNALGLLSRLQSTAQASGRVGSELKALVLQAVAFDRAAETPQAWKCLERAVMLAENGNYIRTFVEAGSNMGPLLSQYHSLSTRTDYINRLLAACQPPSRPDHQHLDLPDPLSDRELEVLRLIMARLSNREIAQSLHISVNTARTHVRNIYSKLDVHSQSQAAQRAQELRLIR